MKSPESSPSSTDISPYPESPTVRPNEHSPSKETEPIKQSHLLKSPLQHLKNKRKFIHLRRKSQNLARQVEELWEGLCVSRIILCDNEHILHLGIWWNCGTTIFQRSHTSYKLKLEETLWHLHEVFVFVISHSVVHFVIRVHDLSCLFSFFSFC